MYDALLNILDDIIRYVVLVGFVLLFSVVLILSWCCDCLPLVKGLIMGPGKKTDEEILKEWAKEEEEEAALRDGKIHPADTNTEGVGETDATSWPD